MIKTATIHRLIPSPPGLPAGVTVRQPGEQPTEAKPRNLLERAAMCDDRDWAISAILASLCIKPGDVMKLNLPAASHWKVMGVPARLNMIGDWLRAECFELMDHVVFDQPADMTIGD